jgi:plastocyanin
MRKLGPLTGTALLVLTALIATSSANATIHNIDVGNFFFSPTTTTVCPDDTVRWTLVAGFHSSTSDPSSPKTWDSGVMSTAGQTFDVVFVEADGPGPFPYHCSVHSLTMMDTIYVATDCAAAFTCGDADGSGAVDIDDVVYLIAYIFTGGPAPNPLDAGEVDCSGAIDIDDVVYLIAYIFTGGPAPCEACP